MVQSNYEQMPQNTYPQQGGANAVSINIYNPQAYGSGRPNTQPAPYNYTNSLYQMPEGRVFADQNQNQAQVPPQQYFIPNAAQQVCANPVQSEQIPVMPNQNPQSIVAPAPQMMPDSVIPSSQEVQTQQPESTQDTQESQTQDVNQSEAAQDAQSTQEVASEIPSVDTETLINDLKNQDANVKADAINKIAEYAQEKPEIALQVVSEPIMQALVDVIKEDTTSLEGPTDKQIEIAEKISKGEQLTPEEEALSDQLSPRDKANKNRIFALYTLAMIQKLQRDELNQYIETQKENGEQPINPLNLEDLEGYNDIVNTIKNDQRPEVQVAAIQALEYVAEPGEKAKVEEILADSLKSKDEHVKAAAEETLKKFEA